MLRNFDKYPRYMVDDMNVGYDFDVSILKLISSRT